MKSNKAKLASILLALGCSADLTAQVSDPVPGSIPRSDLVIQIEQFTQIPASSSSAPRARINHLKPAPDGRLFVNDLNGRMYRVSSGAADLYLNLSLLVSDLATSPGLGTGFSSFDFHPNFSANGKLYITYMAPAGAGPADFPPLTPNSPIKLQGVLIELTAANPAANTFSGTVRELMRVDLVGTIHGFQEIAFNRSVTQFSSDYGMLYVTLGDSGTSIAGYPQNTSRLDSPLGSIMRIDPLGTNSTNGQYGIPADNPWASDGDAATLGEIWAYGFRNPHRISWDVGGDGRMYNGDIGERNIEEVNIIEPGRHYGWNFREGTFRFNPNYINNPGEGGEYDVFPLPANDAELGFTYPVAQYDHGEGFSIVGGYVYRGPKSAHLQGVYVFGDIRNGRLFLVDSDDLSLGSQTPIEETYVELPGGSPRTFTSVVGGSRTDLRFGFDNERNVYLLEKQQGRVYLVTGARSLSGANPDPDPDPDPDPTPNLGDLSALATRVRVGAGDNVAIGGLVISGEGERVLIRAVGAELVNAGVAAPQLLANPTLSVLNLSAGGAEIASNDNWDAGSDSAEITAVGAQVGAFPALAAGSQSSAVVLDLPAGIYGVIVSGANGSEGIANVEVYRVK